MQEGIRSEAAPASRLVGDLAAERPARARVFEQLGIDYCCGGRRPLDDACSDRGLDVESVVALLDAEANTLDEPDWMHAPLSELCDHIVAVHHGYLRRELPRLTELLAKCERAHGDDRPELVEARETFEHLRAELEHHLADEERRLFPACRRLDAGDPPGVELPNDLLHLEAEHAAAGALLERLSILTDGYDTSGAACNTHRAALSALAELERDMHEHVHEENNILFQRVAALSA